MSSALSAAFDGHLGAEGFALEDRVRRKVDYEHCYKSGRRLHASCLTLHFFPSPSGHARLGMTVSRRVGKSVVRQKLKRRVREIYRRWRGRPGLPPMDYVVHLKPAAADSSFETLSEALISAFATVVSRTGRAQ